MTAACFINTQLTVFPPSMFCTIIIIIIIIIIITQSALQHVHRHFQTEFSTKCHLVRALFQLPVSSYILNLLTPNDPYMGRTAPLTSKRCILYIYSTNIGTEYFKHALYSPFFALQNVVYFIMLTCLVPVLFTFYLQGVLKLKK